MRYDYLFESLSKTEADGYLALCGGESTLAQFQTIFHRPATRPASDPRNGQNSRRDFSAKPIRPSSESMTSLASSNRRHPPSPTHVTATV